MNFEPLTIISSDAESSIRWFLDHDCDSSVQVGDKTSDVLVNPCGTIKLGVPSTSGAEAPKKKYQLRTSSPALDSSQILFPSYAPPPAASIDFCMHLKGNVNVPEKPKLPTCKTNTNMATYVHKRFMYQVYVAQLRGPKQEPQSKSVSTSSLKHSYLPSLSRSQSFILSLSSGRLPLMYSYSQIFDDPVNPNVDVY